MIKKISIILITLILLAVLSGCLYYGWLINKPKIIDPGRNIVEIKSGESVAEIAKKLQDRGIIDSDQIFVLYAELKKKPLQAGIYRVPAPATIASVYSLISSGTVTHKKVTIPEGYRLEQIAQRLERNGFADYSDFVTKAKPYEGMLFPDTYFFPLDASTDTIISKMKSNYVERTKNLKLTQEDLIIASIVEREAVTDEERPLIAGVFKNRLKLGMKLEADPTVYYGNDTNKLTKLTTAEKEEYTFWQPIPLKEYGSVDSSYNTYVVPALPAGPISNPGLASLQATVNYQEHDYIFFLQNGGKIYPAKTEAEHNQNRAKVLGVKFPAS